MPEEKDTNHKKYNFVSHIVSLSILHSRKCRNLDSFFLAQNQSNLKSIWKNIKTLQSTFTYFLALSFNNCPLLHHKKKKEACHVIYSRKTYKISCWQFANRTGMLRFSINVYYRKNERSSQMRELRWQRPWSWRPGSPGRWSDVFETLVGLLPTSQVLASPAIPGDTQTGPHTALLCRRGFFCPQRHPDTALGQGLWMGRLESWV